MLVLARRHAAAGDLAAVVAALSGPLARLDLSAPDPLVVYAAALFAQALAATGPSNLDLAVRWAAYAQQSSHDAFGCADPRRIWPVQVYARLLTKVSDTAAATAAYRDLVAMLTGIESAAATPHR